MTTKTTLSSTPHECATKTKPNLDRIPHFGQEVLVLIGAASKLNSKLNMLNGLALTIRAKATKSTGLINSQFQSKET